MNRGPFTGRQRLWAGALAGGLLAVCWASVQGVTRSRWLHEWIRARLASEIEVLTGASVSIAALELGSSSLEFIVRGLEVRSGASHALPPVLEVPEASLRLGWKTLFGGVAVVEELAVRRPVLRLSLGERGFSNLPTPAMSSEWPSLVVRQFTVSGGAIEWDSTRLDAEFEGSELEAQLRFDSDRRVYDLEARVLDPTWTGAEQGLVPPGSVSVAAEIGAQGIEIRNVSFRGGEFVVSARCVMRDFRSPRFECSYSGSSGIGAAAEWLAESEVGVDGTLRFTGDLEWSADTGLERCEGEVFATANPTDWEVLEANLRAVYSVSGNLIELQGITGDALGGAIDGAARVRRLGGDVELTGSGTVSGIDVAAIASTAGLAAFPWQGTATVSFALSRLPGEEVAGELGLEIFAGTGPGNPPVEGRGAMRFGAPTGGLAISELRLVTPGSQVSMEGAISASGTARLDVSAVVNSTETLGRLVSAVSPGIAITDATPDGTYTFRGVLAGRLGEPGDVVADGHLAITDFVFGGQRWERLSVSGSASASGFDIREGELTDGEGRLTLRGTVPTANGGDWDVGVTSAGMSARKVLAATGFEMPVEGPLAMRMRISGSADEPTAHAHVRIESPSIFLEQFDLLEGEAIYGPERLALKNATLARRNSELVATGSVSRDNGFVEFKLGSDHWPLEEFALVRSVAPELSGTGQLRLLGSGTLGESDSFDMLQIEGSLEIADLRRGSVHLGHWKADLKSAAESAAFDLVLNGDVFEGSVQGRAALWQAEPATYSAIVEFHDLRTFQLAELFDLPFGNVRGAASGSAEFRGVAGDSETFEAVGTIDRLEIGLVQDGKDVSVLTNLFPMRWDVREGTLRLDSMNLSARNADIEVDGSIAMTGERELDLDVTGTLDIALFGGLLDGAVAEGPSNVSIRIAGTLDEPSLQGTVELRGATLASQGSPIALNDVRGAITFRGSQCRFDGVTASSGGGTVSLKGVMAYRKPAFEYRIQAGIADVRVDYPPSVSSLVDGEVTLAGVGSRSILSGEVLVSRMSTADNVSFSDLLAPAGSSEVDSGGGSPLLDTMQVNVRVGSVSSLAVETVLVRDMEADFDLRVVGTVANPSILGTVRVPQGEIRMLGTHYRITSGDIRFENPLSVEPVLNMELETRIRDVDIELVLAGPARSLDLSYRSDPPLPFHELVNLVIVGKEPAADPTIASQRRIEQQSLVQTGADNLLSQAIERPVSRRLQRFFGVSRLKVDPQIGGLEANPSARISTEQQIADDLTLIYSYDLSSAQQQAIRVEWNPDRKWKLLVTRDQNGFVGGDVLFKARMR